MDEIALLERLHELLSIEAARHGDVVDEVDIMINPDLEVYQVGESGVLAFVGDYLLVAWPPDERAVASPKAYRLIAQRLKERGFIRHMVHFRNVESIIATRRLGAVPMGIDKDGYIHYTTTAISFRNRGKRTGLRSHDHGQEVTSPEGPGPVADLRRPDQNRGAVERPCA